MSLPRFKRRLSGLEYIDNAFVAKDLTILVILLSVKTTTAFDTGVTIKWK